MMEASEIASRYMAEIETFALDASPANLDEETEEGNFLVHVLIMSLGYGVNVDETDNSPGVGGAQNPTGLRTLLKSKMPGMNRHLVSTSVNVAWEEELDQRSVRRTYCAFNLAEARNADRSKDANKAAQAEKKEASEEGVGDRKTEEFQG